MENTMSLIFAEGQKPRPPSPAVAQWLARPPETQTMRCVSGPQLKEFNPLRIYSGFSKEMVEQQKGDRDELLQMIAEHKTLEQKWRHSTAPSHQPGRR